MNPEVKVVKRDVYNGYEYFITKVYDAWYCAYVIIPKNHPIHGIHYDNIVDIDVHGGITFSNYHRCVEDQWCIGWDYNHIGDYNEIFGGLYNWLGEPLHKWTPEEIEIDCQNVIDQLNKKYPNAAI